MSTAVRVAVSAGIALFVAFGPPRSDSQLSVVGTPLLELHGQGLQRTLRVIPNCGLSFFPACDFRDPRFTSWHVVLLRDGRGSLSVTENALDDAAGSRAQAVLGTGDPDLLAELRAALEESRIGFATGACRVTPDYPTPGTNDRVEVLDLDWRLAWYGRGNRITLLDLPVNGVPLCDRRLDRLVETAVRYAQSLRQADGP
jgi:hypothetical protein